MKYKAGDIVRIKTWEEMLADGFWQGTDNLENFQFGEINFPQDAISFPEYGQYLCGQEFTVELRIHGNSNILATIDNFSITESMVTLVLTLIGENNA